MVIFLVYHRVSAALVAGRYTIGVDSLVNDIATVRRSMVPILNPHDLELSPQNVDGVIFCFDDGTADHHQVVLPTLAERGIYGLFYVPTVVLGQAGHLSQGFVRELCRAGHTVGSHGHSHSRLDHMPLDALRAELLQSRDILHDIAGECPRHIAPPGGFFSPLVQVAAQQLGLTRFRTMEWGCNRHFDPMRIEAIPMTNRLTRSLLPSVLRRRGDWLLKAAHRSKESLRGLAVAGRSGRARLVTRLARGRVGDGVQ